MIQVNLFSGITKGTSRRDWVPQNQRASATGLILLFFTALVLAGWWWEMNRETLAVDGRIAQGQLELARLKTTAALVDKATARKAELLERLSLIDRLHRIQHAPVELLEVVSRSIPDGLWLMELKQQNDSIQIEGRAQTLTAVTDFVEHLQTSGYFQHPVDILTTTLETVQETSVVRFAIKGVAPSLATPPPPKAVKAGH